MSDDPVISVQNISKVYRIWDKPAARLTSPLFETAGEVFSPASGTRRWLQGHARKHYRDFYALRDVGFEVRQGEAVGIIGRNGSGKSTLLQIIAGTLQPTEGKVKVTGRVAALLELGSGFNPEFTGRENVILNGTILGFTAKQMAAKFDRIAEFADIGDFIEQPVKIYSSGMMVRLAFAVQTAVDPDILIVDEALSVGDFFFQQKCFKRIAQLRERGTTILFVSHDMASVRDITTRALLLQEGRAVFFGETQHAVSLYFQEKPVSAVQPAFDSPPAAAIDQAIHTEAFLAKAFWRGNAANPSPTEAGAIILGAALLDAAGRAAANVELGQKATISLLIKARAATTFITAIEFKNRHDQIACSFSTAGCGLPPLTLAAGQHAQVDFEIVFNLEAGLYTVCGIIGHPGPKSNRGVRIHATPWAGPIKVDWDYENQLAPFLGMFGPPLTVRTHVSN